MTQIRKDMISMSQPVENPRPTSIEHKDIAGLRIPVYINSFWTPRQRQALPIHEVSYRACFKPQLPRFFIERFSQKEDIVYDPFAGRGTTPIEAALLERRFVANDVNPLSKILALPRFFLPDPAALAERLAEIPLKASAPATIDLTMFYHRDTEAELLALRQYLLQRRDQGREDALDAWIRMVATNRLTGHSPGFFSVYTLPPNQAVSAERQIRINQKREQIPPYRDVRRLILKKSKQLLRRISPEQASRLKAAGESGYFYCEDARSIPAMADNSVQLTVTSPPFLNVVQYAADNWLRCWFNDIDARAVAERMTLSSSLPQWQSVMGNVFHELYRITRPEGWVAFEVGEVRKGRLQLEDYVVPLGLAAGFTCRGIFINRQKFTKTANIWGIHNNSAGTNSNRIVLFQK